MTRVSTLTITTDELQKFCAQLETDLCTALSKPIMESVSCGLEHGEEMWVDDDDHTNCKPGEFVFKSITRLKESKLFPTKLAEWYFIRTSCKLSSFSMRDHKPCYCDECEYVPPDYCNACDSELVFHIARLTDSFRNRWTDGMCLDCIRAGVVQGEGKNCRINHGEGMKRC
jgi:hypothetical protein